MLQPIVSSISLVYFGNGNNLLFFVDKKENPVVSNLSTEDVFFAFDFPWLGGKGIFETQNLLKDPLSIVLWDFAEELLHILVNLYSIHRSSASINSESRPFFIISLCFLISSSSSGVRVESNRSSMTSSIWSILCLISLNSLRTSDLSLSPCLIHI